MTSLRTLSLNHFTWRQVFIKSRPTQTRLMEVFLFCSVLFVGCFFFLFVVCFAGAQSRVGREVGVDPERAEEENK